MDSREKKAGLEDPVRDLRRKEMEIRGGHHEGRCIMNTWPGEVDPEDRLIEQR